MLEMSLQAFEAGLHRGSFIGLCSAFIGCMVTAILILREGRR